MERDFNVHIDHYAWIGLLGLVNLIDKVGGVDVVASNPVLDDFYPKDLSGTNPYAIERVAVLPGPQHMDGMEALQYVRSRHDDLRSDFGRSVRQQQVLLALRAKAKLLGIADVPGHRQRDERRVHHRHVGDAGGRPPPHRRQRVAEQRAAGGAVSRRTRSRRPIGSQDVVVPNWNLILPLVHKYFPNA